ncbi:hypothetical protein [Actinokineospora pegani]|uniref:hypothetical protein n=1 Tax=Actinokineospora pegani TaxID=2654637 RepID=UPI0012E9BDD0|nr:hypothetical protein [Actinokineospora pegani]
MPVRAIRSSLAALVLLGALLVGTPLAASAAAAQPAPPATTAPAGPTIDNPDEADAARSRNNLVIGAIALVLLGVVIYGNRARAKKKGG